jgi:hypothetical protein
MSFVRLMSSRAGSDRISGQFPDHSVFHYVPSHLGIILLAYYQLGGLEGKALQRAIFLVLLFASEAGKKQHQRTIFAGRRAPQPPQAS